jgi:hypothetical protein
MMRAAIVHVAANCFPTSLLEMLTKICIQQMEIVARTLSFRIQRSDEFTTIAKNSTHRDKQHAAHQVARKQPPHLDRFRLYGQKLGTVEKPDCFHLQQH